MTYAHDNFNWITDYHKHWELLHKASFINPLSGEGLTKGFQRTFAIIEEYNINDGEELTLFYIKSDVCLLTDIFQKFIKISSQEDEIDILVCQLSKLYLAMLLKIYWYQLTNIKRSRSVPTTRNK